MITPEQTAIILKYGSMENAWELWFKTPRDEIHNVLEKWELAAITNWIMDKDRPRNGR